MKERIKKFKNILAWANSRLNPTARILLGLYFINLIVLHFSSTIQVHSFDFYNLFIIVLGVISLIVLTKSIDLYLGKLPRFRIGLNFFLILIYLLIGIYHFRSRGSFDFAVVYDNFAEIFNPEVPGIILGLFNPIDYVVLTLGIVTLVICQLRYKWLRARSGIRYAKWHLLALPVIYFTIIISPWLVYDEFTFFIQSAYRHLRPSAIESELFHQLYKIPYPYIKEIKEGGITKKSGKFPNIFIIFVESFNASFVEKRTKEGLEYTPYFNSLIKKGVYIPNYFSTSVQTSKGHFSAVCGLLPLIKGKAFSWADKTDFNCIPKILGQYDYQTVFFQSYSNLEFDNTNAFMKKAGFNTRAAADSLVLTKEELERYKWGWGLQDSVLYQQGFELLDKLHERHLANGLSDPRFFMTFATISNHMRFNQVPREQRYLYPDQKNRFEYFANSIRVTDEYLKAFFNELAKRDYLKNSLVIISGDHGFPAGEHGGYSIEAKFYNELFKVPMLLLWKDNLIPQRITYKASSHIDIPPTILDLLGIEHRNHFVGKSIFEFDQGNKIYLVQPYDGIYLSVVEYPYKYVYHMRSKQEYLFKLDVDPLEKNNLISLKRHSKLAQRLRLELSQISLNDRLIKENRIWKAKIGPIP